MFKNKNLVTQKAQKSNTIVIFGCISKLSKIFEDTSKFERVNIGEWKVLNHLTQREKRMICLLKSLDDQNETSEKD